MRNFFGRKWRPFRASLMLSMGLAMSGCLAGCAHQEAAAPPPAAVADEATITARIQARCPDASVKDRANFQRVTPRPTPPVTRAQDRAWHDSQETAELSKNSAGQRVLGLLDACRGVAHQPTS